MKHLKTYNESISSYLKPKPKDNSLNLFKNIDDKDKMVEIIYNNCIEYFDYDEKNFFDFVYINILDKIELYNRIKKIYSNFNFDKNEHLYLQGITITDVLNILTKDELIKFFSIMIGINESISSYLKPRKDDDIRDKIKNLSPTQKLLNGAEYGLLWLVQEALNEGADPSFDDQSAFNIACDYGHIEIIKELLKDKRVDPSDLKGFMWAIESEHYDVVKLLLKDKRVDPTINDNETIKYASNVQNYKAVEILLNDERVMNTLNKSQINYYKDKIKH